MLSDTPPTREPPQNLESLRLNLSSTEKEGLLVGMRKNGRSYSVRTHRKNYLMPDIWLKLIEHLATEKAKLTAEVLVQTGARINEARHIEERDIDYTRNTIRLRVTKAKARKKGEERGVPRTIPMNTHFIKRLKKHFKTLPPGAPIGILTTSAANTALKNALQEAGVEDFYMYSIHNLRKTHGNWLKIMGNLKLMNVDISEICLRLSHDPATFIRDYGSSGVMNTQDVMIIQQVLGDLYQR